MVGDSVDDEFQASLFGERSVRFLESLAHLLVIVVAGLSLHSAWRQSEGRRKYLPEPHANDGDRRTLAWRGVDFCDLGLDSRSAALSVSHKAD